MKDLINKLASKNAKITFYISKVSRFSVTISVFLAILGLFLLFKQNIFAVRFLLFLSLLFLFLGYLLGILIGKVILHWKEGLMDFEKYQGNGIKRGKSRIAKSWIWRKYCYFR